jgi:HAE1 family hydrophobic/amphiphilic exporter-1
MFSGLVNPAFSQAAQIASAEKTIEKSFAGKTDAAEPNAAREKTKIIAQIVGERLKPLSLREAVEMALQNNPDTQVSQKNVKIAEFDLQSASGAFDARLFATTDFERVKSPLTNSIFSTNNSTIKSRVLTNSVRIEKPLNRFGTILSGEFSNSFQTTNDPFNSFRRSFQPAFNFSLVQPILRGRRFDDARRQIEIAKKNLNLTDQQFRRQTIEIIAQVEQAYWNLAFALKELQVQQDAVRDTVSQLDTTRRRVEQGSIAPIEIVSLDNQIAKFESAGFQSLDAVTRAQNALKNLIAPDENANLWNEAILPTDDINLDVPDVSLSEAVATAFENRLELKQNETSRVINQINRRFYEEQTKPQLDVRINYTANGFAGTPNDSNFNFGDPNLTNRVNELSALAELPPLPGALPSNIPNNLNGGFGNSLANLFRQNFGTFQFGVTFNFPIKNRTAKAELGKNLVEAEKLDIEKRRVLQQITAEVRNAVQTLQTLKMRLQSVRTSRASAEQEYESEKRKYDSGYVDSSLFVMLEKQKNLTAAKASEVQIRLELNKAIADFNRAVGNLPKDISNFFR